MKHGRSQGIQGDPLQRDYAVVRTHPTVPSSMKDEYDFSKGVRGKYKERYDKMTNVQELFVLVQRGALGVGDTAVEAAREACKIILKEDYLGMTGWPDKPVRPQPTEKKTYAPRPNDKGYKMKAKLSGMCSICNGAIIIGDDIYYKKGEGAFHVICKDEVTKLVP